MGLPCPQRSQNHGRASHSRLPGGRNLHLRLERRIQIVKGKGESVPGGRSSVNRDPERKIHTADSRTVGSIAREERCTLQEREAKWEGERCPKSEASPPLSPIWFIEPTAPSPSTVTLQPGEALEGPRESEAALALSINLPGNKEICNLIKMTCCCPF